MTIRQSPFDSLEQAVHRLNKQLENISQRWEDGGQHVLSDFEFESLVLDVAESDTEFVVTADVPGFDRDELDVRVSDQTLYIEAEHEAESEANDDEYLRREREHRSLNRSLRLPDNIESDGIEASLENGVLTVTIPKSVPGRNGKKIDIE